MEYGRRCVDHTKNIFDLLKKEGFLQLTRHTVLGYMEHSEADMGLMGSP